MTTITSNIDTLWRTLSRFCPLESSDRPYYALKNLVRTAALESSVRLRSNGRFVEIEINGDKAYVPMHPRSCLHSLFVDASRQTL
jgi:hypothetical protein